MPKILFKTDGIVSGKVVFEAGKIYEISDEKGSATRWLKRGAELVVEKEEPVKAVEVEAEAKEEEVIVVKKPSKKENKKEIKTSK